MKLTKQEKIQLLKNYLGEDILVKSIVETLSPQELDMWINQNLNVMVRSL